MYKNKIVCAIKHNNTPLTEKGNTVFIPFDTQYSIYLKNTSNVTAFISIFVNGRNVSPGQKIKLRENTSCEVNKFQDTDHSFVFKKKTKKMEKVIPDNGDDGLIQVKVELMREHTLNDFPLPKPGFLDNHNIDTSVAYSNSVFSSYQSKNSRGFSVPGKKISKIDDLILVNRTSAFGIEQTFDLVLRLKETEKIENHKKICPTCSKTFKSKYFYCPFDGTFLDKKKEIKKRGKKNGK